MTNFDAILLGLVQGLTEFLPVSSSGHLVIIGSLLNVDAAGIIFEVMVHVGTALAVCVFLRREIAQVFAGLIRLIRAAGSRSSLARVIRSDEGARLGALVAVGSIPTALMGLCLSEVADRLFESVLPAGLGLIVTGLVLRVAQRHDKGDKGVLDVSWLDAVTVGVAQGLDRTRRVEVRGHGSLLADEGDVAASRGPAVVSHVDSCDTRSCCVGTGEVHTRLGSCGCMAATRARSVGCSRFRLRCSEYIHEADQPRQARGILVVLLRTRRGGLDLVGRMNCMAAGSTLQRLLPRSVDRQEKVAFGRNEFVTRCLRTRGCSCSARLQSRHSRVVFRKEMNRCTGL